MRRHMTYLLSACFLFGCGEEKSETRVEYVDRFVDDANLGVTGACETNLQTECEEIRKELDSARSELNEAIENKDRDMISRKQIEVNELTEILRSYTEGKSDISEIRKRYQAIRNILNDSAGQSTVPNISYEATELAAVREVFEDFGNLYIEPTPVDESGRSRTIPVLAVADEDRPWTSYWYPKGKTEIFEDENSTLAKFDQYLRSKGLESSAAEWERNRWRPGIYTSWEGLCDALALAAVLTNEPKESVTLNDVTFSVVDQKALAIKYYEAYEPKVYGLRYDGSSRTDGEMQDLRPEAFHRILEVLLGEKQQSVVIDTDPGPEVWSKPIYRVTWSIAKDHEVENAYVVSAFPSLMSQRANLPTSDEEAMTDFFRDSNSPKYEYRLYVDPSDKKGEKMKVVAGEWINGSAENHPDFVVLPVSMKNEKIYNHELAKHGAELEELLYQLGIFPSEPVDN
ncbi:MAG: hypothetical protein ACOH5I_00460 [Oligoflexus sp.]